MKYAIVKVTDGNYFIHAEGIIDLGAKKNNSSATSIDRRSNLPL